MFHAGAIREKAHILSDLFPRGLRRIAEYFDDLLFLRIALSRAWARSRLACCSPCTRQIWLSHSHMRVTKLIRPHESACAE